VEFPWITSGSDLGARSSLERGVELVVSVAELLPLGVWLVGLRAALDT
jgi:hypothetical protein